MVDHEHGDGGWCRSMKFSTVAMDQASIGLSKPDELEIDVLSAVWL